MSLINSKYFRSADVKVYPATYRGNYEIATGEYAGQIYTFDPEARMQTEANIIRAGGKLSKDDTYIINWDSENKVLICVIGGYYFELSNVDLNDFVYENSDNIYKSKHLNIVTRSITIKSDTDSIYNENSYDSPRTTKILASQYSETSESLDVRIPVDGENEEAYVFTGLSVDTDDNTTAATASLIPITVSASGTPSINYAAFKPRISSGLGVNNTTSGIIVNSIQIGNESEALADASFASGTGTKAVGENSSSFGIGTTAKGIASHAEGFSDYDDYFEVQRVLANGQFVVASVDNLAVNDILKYPTIYGDLYFIVKNVSSNNTIVLEGDDTSKISVNSNLIKIKGISYGNYSHVEGNQTTAFGENSHAEGNLTIANGASSHAEGFNTTASGNKAHAEGDNTTAAGNKSHAEGAYVNDESPDTPTNCGAYGVASHTEGYNTKTTETAIAGHAEGARTAVYAKQGHAEGYHAIVNKPDENDDDSGIGAHAEGFSTTTNNKAAHAEGELTTASGEASHAEGNNTIAESNYSHAEGVWTKASGIAAHAEGGTATAENSDEQTYTEASGDYSHAEGKKTKAKGTAAHAEGIGTSAGEGAACIGAHAEGYETVAVNSGTHAEGEKTRAEATNSHAEGFKTKTTASNAHAEGEGNGEDKGIASGTDSHSEGRLTIACGYGSHAEGNETIAGDTANVNSTSASYYSHAEGIKTIAKGSGSHAEGIGTIAQYDYQHVFGKYNAGVAGYVELVGGGTDENNPANIRTLDWSGNEWLRGTLTAANVQVTHNIKTETITIDSTGEVTGKLTVKSTDKLLTNGTGSAAFEAKGSSWLLSNYKDKSYIGLAVGSEKAFYVTGDGKVNAYNYNATSDARLKENLVKFNSEKSILDLPVYKYDFIDGPKNQIGCLAQDLKEICPEIVSENENGFLSIQEGKLVYLLLEEVKKLKKEVEELKK